MTDTPELPPLRSAATYGKRDRDGFIHRSWMKAEGLPDHVFDGRPVIGICQTFSEFNPCHSHLRGVAESVKAGVWEAGGLPLEFPAMSLGETQIRPTAMLFRNLMSMDVEESIRGYAMDGVVLLGGCDKNSPAMLMGAASVGLPAMLISSGPMLNGKFRGKDIGSGTDVWRFSEEVRAGTMTNAEFMSAEAGMSRSPGTCMTMGTASTLACIFEAMGLSLSYNGTIPGVDARRKAMAHETGNRIVELVRQRALLNDTLTRTAFENGVKICAAIGGSTNAVLHLLALAGRAGVQFDLADWQQLGASVPLIVDLMPSGRFLMEDLHYAGGIPAVIRELGDLLRPRPRRGLGPEPAPGRGRRAQLQPGSHPLGRQAVDGGGRAGHPEGQPLPARCRHQARRRVPRTAQAPRPRRGVRLDRGLPRPCRRSRSRHRRVVRHGPQGLRAARLPGHARGRQHAAAPQAARDRRPRHGADQRRADEWYRVRHRRSALRPRSARRRPAGTGPRR